MTSDEARAKAENCITLVEWYGLTGDGAAIRQVLDEHAALRQRVADLERERDAAIRLNMELKAERDGHDCTRREGGDTRHCRHDRPCLRCRMEREHISREDREQALELAKEAEQASVTPCGHSDAKAFDVKWAEARRLLKLDGEG